MNLSEIIRNSSNVREFLVRERRKHQLAGARHAESLAEFDRAAQMLTARMVASGHWIIGT